MKITDMLSDLRGRFERAHAEAARTLEPKHPLSAEELAQDQSLVNLVGALEEAVLSLEAVQEAARELRQATKRVRRTK